MYPRDEPGGPALNALFAEDRPNFTPAYSALFPEYYATAIQTETVVRDMAPITTTIYDVPHGRNARVIGGKIASCPLWLTEIGLHPREHGVVDREAALRLKAKATARDACFFPAKGVERIYFFSALGGDTGYGLVSDRFAEYARTGKPYPADEAAYVSPRSGRCKTSSARCGSGLVRAWSRRGNSPSRRSPTRTITINSGATGARNTRTSTTAMSSSSSRSRRTAIDS